MGGKRKIHIILLKTMNVSDVKESFSVAEHVCCKTLGNYVLMPSQCK